MGNSGPQNLPPPSIPHPKFKNSVYLKDLDIIRSTLITQSQSQYQQWVQKLNKTASIDDQVILLPKAYQLLKKALCGSSCTLQIDYDNYQYILADQLKNRRSINGCFQETQLWYLLYCLVTAAYDFGKLGDRIGDVRPQNIFINEQGHIKVSNLYSWPGEQTNYSKTVYDHERTYLSPQQSQSARQGQTNNYVDKYKAQSFSIGLTVLETAMIKDLGYLYLSNHGFDYGQWPKLVNDWWAHTYVARQDQGQKTQQSQGAQYNQNAGQNNKPGVVKRYSDVFKAVVMGLCELKPEDRLLAEQVYKWLKPYHKQINQIKQFNPGVPPLPNLPKYSKPPQQAPIAPQQAAQSNYFGGNGSGDGYRQVFDKIATGQGQPIQNTQGNQVLLQPMQNVFNYYSQRQQGAQGQAGQQAGEQEGQQGLSENYGQGGLSGNYGAGQYQPNRQQQQPITQPISQPINQPISLPYSQITSTGTGYMSSFTNQPAITNTTQNRAPSSLSQNLYTMQTNSYTISSTTQQYQPSQYISQGQSSLPSSSLPLSSLPSSSVPGLLSGVSTNPNIRPFNAPPSYPTSVPSTNPQYTFTSSSSSQLTASYQSTFPSMNPTATAIIGTGGTTATGTTSATGTATVHQNNVYQANVKGQQITSSQVRSLDFLRQIDEKLDRLKQDAI